MGVARDTSSLLRAILEPLYLAVLLGGIILGQSMDYFFGSEPMLRGQSVSILIPLASVALAVVLWLFSGGSPPKRLGIQVFVAALFATWCVIGCLIIAGHASRDYTFLAFGILSVMLILKTPRAASISAAINYCFLLIALLFTFAALWPLLSDGSYAVHQIDWPGLPSILPDLQRWHAPFNGPAEAAGLGALLCVWGVTRRGFTRTAFVTVGITMLFFGGNLAAVIAGVAGLLVLITARLRRTTSPRKFAWFVSLVAIACTLSLILVLSADPGLNGRSGIWKAFLAMWQEEPWLGVGPNAISAYSQSLVTIDGVTAFGAPDGHNLLIDTLARFGIFGATLVSLTIAVALVVVSRSVGRSGPLPLAIVISIMMLACTETIFVFASSSILLFVFIYAVMLTAKPPTVSKSSSTKLPTE
jgi:O-antigen ligase